MNRIYKYQIHLNSIRDGAFEFHLQMPEGAVVRCVGMQDDYDYLWVEVDERAPLVDRTFYSIGTGHGAVPDGAVYIGTVFDTAGYVWHVYEQPKTRS